MEEEAQRYANGLQGRRNKTPEGAIYGKDEPSVTGGSGDDEILGGMQGRTSQGEEAQELCAPREPDAPQQTSQSAQNPRNTISDPSDTYLAPQFQESFNQVARAVMNEINRTTGRTLGRVVPSQRLDRSSSGSERIHRAIVPTGTTHGGTTPKSCVVDIRKKLTVRNQFVQVAAEHPRACLNGMSWNPAMSNQAIPPGSRHLVVGDSLVRDLNEIFVNGQTTVLYFGGASVAQVIKMMKF